MHAPTAEVAVFMREVVQLGEGLRVLLAAFSGRSSRRSVIFGEFTCG